MTVKNYETEWKKVDEAVKKDLPKTALDIVKKIYQQARKDGQDAQIIKSLVYMTGLQDETREDNELTAIADVEKEIPQAKEPVVSILKSYLAGLYWNYYQQHRYQLYSRTQTSGFDLKDIATWAPEDFHKKISTLYLQSIADESILQKTNVEDYTAIINKGNTRKLRPTLYDLLAHQALSYFKNDERDINKPAYIFEISEPQAFADAVKFAGLPFQTKDSLSLQLKALGIYQQLIKFHLKVAHPAALIDADIERIAFVHQKSIHSQKDSLYAAALENLSAKYPKQPAAAQAAYLLAEYYNGLANKYQPNGDTTHRYTRLKAKQIAENILLQDSASEGKTNAYNLLQQINQKGLNFQVEKVNIPAKPFRVLVTYKNMQTVYLKLIRTDEKLQQQLENQYDAQFWKALIAAPAYRAWQQALPATNDLQEHSVEIKVDGMPAGEYVLVASTDAAFNEKQSSLAARLFYVSNISFINNQGQYFVLHRETGQPLQKADVQLWKQEYDYASSRNKKIKGDHFTTDDHGYFQITNRDEKNRNYNFLLDIKKGDDELFMNEWMYDYYYSPQNDAPNKEISTRIFLFSDRSIYRPGQTVYYKGIAVSHGPGSTENNIRDHFTTKVYLRDANYQLIDSANFTTNEYGSFSGKFTLPQTGLNGQFTISTKDREGDLGIRVEDYKRPKYYVDFEKIKNTFKVNDSIHVTGTAKAYAGNNIDNAIVKYRVVRQPRFIYPWLFSRWWQPRAEPMEIAHGETTTAKDGSFNIAFKAIPDLSIDKKFDPVFDYRIYADVTDANGETRSGEQVVTVSYKALLLQLSVNSPLQIDSLKNISIRTQNMSKVFVPAMVKLSAYKLMPEKRLIRIRYWQQPDQYIMSREEYIQNFPHDEYKNESDIHTWQRGEKVFEKADSTKEDGLFSINPKNFEPGWYVFEVETTDKNGNIVKDVQYVELTGAAKDFSNPQYLRAQGTDDILEPGQATHITIGTAAGNVFLVQQINRATETDQKSLNQQFDFINLDKDNKTFSFTAKEEDRGGYGVTYFFIKDNRFYSFSEIIKVPWSNKDLQVEYETFRDKTLPGSEEKWTIKIKGYKNEKVAAEMLASMYDASLDQFLLHQWSKPGIWPVYSSMNQWNARHNFSGMLSFQKEISKPWKEFDKRYDDFIFDDFGQRYYPLQGRVAGVQVESQLDEVVVAGYDQKAKVQLRGAANKESDTTMKAEMKSEEVEQTASTMNDAAVKVRTNFNETAFFFPDLHTDNDGNISFSFTMPEALTRWKFQTIAHNKQLAFAYSSKEIITQKELMVQTNAPRFLRVGDHLEMTAKLVNLSGKEITGQAELQLFDATTNQPVDGWFQNIFPNQYFTIAAGQSDVVKFPIEVPYLFNKALTWRIVAKAGNYSDGEENVLPVLSNRILVTETMSLPMKGYGNKNFSFDKLLAAGSSESLQNFAFTIEYTSNPAWYAVQALPYLADYPYDCAEQTWNRLFANALASKIANSSPRIKAIFDKWKTEDTAALLSNLQKNQELKSVLLEETPWVLQAKTEEAQKKNIALLFDMTRMSKQLNESLEKLLQMQSPNGGFVWFQGGPDDRYITQYIMTGIGQLRKMNAIPDAAQKNIQLIVSKALPYLDKKLLEDYKALRKVEKQKIMPVANIQAQYLYMRSFFTTEKIPAATTDAYHFYSKQAQQSWTKQGKYAQGMIALAVHRGGDDKTANAIIKSLKETSINNEELGRYWKELASPGWFWYQAPIEIQSLMMEAFSEISNDHTVSDELRTWLLKNKQTNHWHSTKATASAVYALLMNGSDWLANEPAVTIKAGDAIVSDANVQKEAGTGYIKKTFEAQDIKPVMGNISVTVAPAAGQAQQTNASTWGAAYWQYFEDMDKVNNAATPLQLNKKLFIEKNTDRGPVLSPVADGESLKVGDKIKVRIELRVDRDMEYVHMKDMRASALEPVNVLSGYKWQGGLGYYETTRDAATSFFFSYLRKGTYVFEYSLFVTHNGTFSNGITSIQSMYAPEFSAHSEAIRIRVD